MNEKAKEVYYKLLNIGFLTGSRAYGNNKKDADYDIVISLRDKKEAVAIIRGLDIVRSNYFNGLYITIGEVKLNVIYVHPNDFEPWEMTTKVMTTIVQNAIMSKETRCRMFEALIVMFRTNNNFTLKENGCPY